MLWSEERLLDLQFNAETISLFSRIHRVVRRKTVVSTRETDGFRRGNRWSTAWKLLVSHEEYKRLPVGTRQQNGWGWMQNRPKKLHIWLILPRICHSITISVTSQPIVFQLLKPQVTNLQIFEENFWFCVNLGGNGLLQSLTNYLIIKVLVNKIKLQMCVFFRIFVCEFKSEKAPICMAQRYEEIWTYASNRPDKISRD